MEDDVIFYGHLVCFTVFCYILCTFCIVRGNLVYFFRFGVLFQEKSGNPEGIAPGNNLFVVEKGTIIQAKTIQCQNQGNFGGKKLFLFIFCFV
jgi:hypothetical protein